MKRTRGQQSGGPDASSGTGGAPGFDMKVLGTRFKAAREERGLTMRAVAERAGYSVTHISQIERGSTCPTIGALARIAAALGHDAHYFLEADPHPEVRMTPRGKGREQERVDLPPGTSSTLRTLYLSEGISGGRLRVSRATVGPHASVEQAEPVWIPAMILSYLTRGSLVILAGEEKYQFHAGDSFTVQPNVMYRFYNPGPDDVELMAVSHNEQLRWIPGRGQLVASFLNEKAAEDGRNGGE